MRRKNGLVLFTVLALVFLLAAPVSAATVNLPDDLTIDEAIAIAQANNRDSKKNVLEVEKSLKQLEDLGEAIYMTSYTSGEISTATQTSVSTYQSSNIAYLSALRTRDRNREQVEMNVISAYSTVLSSINQLEQLELDLTDLDKREKVMQQSKALGLVSEQSLLNFYAAKEQYQKNYESAQLNYDSAMAGLRGVLGITASQKWEPVLVSQFLPDSYERKDLDAEISRGYDKSDTVWNAQANLNLKESQYLWVLPNESSRIKRIDLDLAALTYEQAKDAVKTQIEQLYYSIDALETQIVINKMQLDQAENDLKLAQVRYNVGVIPLISVSGGDSLNSYQLAYNKAKLTLEAKRSSLANSKTQFAYLTGQQVYKTDDWSDNQ